MKNAYPAVAPRVTPEHIDDERLGAYAGPGGDDASHYNLGHGCRFIPAMIRAEYYRAMSPRSWGMGGKYDEGDMVALIPPGILCTIVEMRRSRGKHSLRYLIRMMATGEERWVSVDVLGSPSIIADLPPDRPYR